MRRAAETYVQVGWSILPVGADKRPLISWAAYQTRPPTSEEIDAWWRRWPDAGIGIVTGTVSGLLVLDIDRKDEAAFEEARSLVECLLPDGMITPMARTRSGGLHYYFRRPQGDGWGNRARIRGMPIDVRCDGGYVVAPPTPGYAWLVSPEQAEPAEVPPALLDWLRPRQTPASHQQTAQHQPDDVVERARRYVAQMPPAISGQGGHNATLRVACVLVHGFALAPEQAWPILCEYNERCEPPWTERELRHKLDEAGRLTTHMHPRGYLLDGGQRRNERPRIVIGPDEHRVVAEAISALARLGRYYSRGAQLVRIVSETPVVGQRAIRVEPVPAPALSVALSEAADWRREIVARSGQVELTATHPPDWAVQGVLTDGTWEGIPPLVGITAAPVLRPDGSLLSTPGYDAQTGLYYTPAGPVRSIPQAPTERDAHRALEALLEIVVDYPFEREEHRSAWLAGLLTPFVRHALRDGCPLLLVESSVAGAGKTTLACIEGILATGHVPPMTAWPADEAEQEKRLTTFLLEGHPVIVLDNLVGRLGGAPLTSVLTATMWQGRVLGRTQSTGRIPVRSTFIATANNCDVDGDIVRRSIHVRIVPQCERPELRSGFRHPDLLRWVSEERPRLVAAALTLLRAYQTAGCPDVGLPPMGSFTSWSRLVRSCVVWAGLPDPVATQQTLRETADRSSAEAAALLDAIASVQERDRWYTAQELLELADRPEGCELRSVLQEYCANHDGALPNVWRLGRVLQRHADRVCQGMALRRRVHRNRTYWRVVRVSSVS